jgi:outer membrane protein OmpA-like peptidoglycan-associated protein
MTITRPARLAALSLLALTMGATAAQARDNNWYIGLRGGVVLPSDRTFYGTQPTRPDFATTEKLGLAAAARLGYDFGRLRTEVDVGYHQTGLKSIDLRSTTALGDAGRYSDPDGQVRNWTIMGNALFDVINSDGFSVSAGAGAGAARVSAHNVRLADGATPFLSSNDWVFAWNALAGARVALSPGVDLAVDYRYLRPNRANFTDTAGQRVTMRNDSHTILVGLNFNFGERRAAAPTPEPVAPMAMPEAAPPPPPPPPPVVEPAAPVTAGPIMLFFDWDSAELSAESRQLVAQAVDPARQQGMARLDVSGHADRSGTGPYNQALGLRRARIVQRELEALGVESSRINVQSFGEERSLVDTVDGQREPQNRRVEISIQPR